MAITLSSICALSSITEFLSAAELIVLHAYGNLLLIDVLVRNVRRYNEFYERDNYYYNIFMKRFLKVTMLYSVMDEYLGYLRTDQLHTGKLHTGIDIPSTIDRIVAPNAIVFINSCSRNNNIYAFCKYWLGVQHGMPLVCRSPSHVNPGCTTDLYISYNGGTFYVPDNINEFERLQTIITRSRCFEYNKMLSKIHTIKATFPNIEIETDLICKYRYCKICSPRRIKRQQCISRWEFYRDIKNISREITKLNIDTKYIWDNEDQVSASILYIDLSIIPQHVTKICLNTYDDSDAHIFDKIIYKNINSEIESLHPYVERLVLKGTIIDSACDLSRFTNLRTIIMKQYYDKTVNLKLIAKKLMAKYPYLVVTII